MVLISKRSLLSSIFFFSDTILDFFMNALSWLEVDFSSFASGFFCSSLPCIVSAFFYYLLILGSILHAEDFPQVSAELLFILKTEPLNDSFENLCMGDEEVHRGWASPCGGWALCQPFYWEMPKYEILKSFLWGCSVL